MTLHVVDGLIQGTDEWLEARRGMVTASVVGQLVTPATLKVAANDKSRTLLRTLVAERITGFTDPTFVTDDMWRGTESEPVARALYAEHYAPVVEVGFMVREDGDLFKLGYSPDGLVGDDGLIEVKAPRAKTHLATILADAVPAYNMAQIQAGLLVTGRHWCDFISFCAGMPLYVKRVHVDLAWHEALTEAVKQFEHEAQKMAAAYEAAVDGLIPTIRTSLDEIRI